MLCRADQAGGVLQRLHGCGERAPLPPTNGESAADVEALLRHQVPLRHVLYRPHVRVISGLHPARPPACQRVLDT